MTRERRPETGWSLYLGQRSWSLVGVAAAVVAVGLAALFVLMAGLLEGIWGIVLGVTLLLLCIFLGGYACYNMAAESRLEHHETPSEHEADERFEQSRKNRRKLEGHESGEVDRS